MAKEGELTDKQKIFCRENYELIDRFTESLISGCQAYCDVDEPGFEIFRSIGRRACGEIREKFNIHNDDVSMFTASYRDKTEFINGVFLRKESDHLYFIQGKDSIKIGRSNDVLRRLSQLQVSSPTKLEIIRVFYGRGCYEFTAHWAFQHIRINGEWFHDTPEIRNFIELLSQNSEIAANYGL